LINHNNRRKAVTGDN